MVDDARRRIEEEEERQVTERSKVEVRLDRSALAQDRVSGELYDVGGRGRGGGLGVGEASGSRSPSPNPAFQATTTPTAATATVLSPSSGFSTNSGTSSNGPTPRISRPLPVPRSDHSSDSTSTRSFPNPPHHPIANSLSASIHSSNSTTSAHSRESSINPVAGGRTLPLTPNLNINTQNGKLEEGTGEEDELQTPIVPSEKALGKRRAVSVRYPTPPPQGKAPELPPLPEGLNGQLGGLRLNH